MYGETFNADTDICAFTVANAVLLLSFGVIKTPQFARRPNLAALPGCVHSMPTGGKQLPILVFLQIDNIEGLKGHPEWKKATNFVG